MAIKSAVEQFALATDAMLRDEESGVSAIALPELIVARRLQATAVDGIADPSFIESLRQELRAPLTTPAVAAAGVSYAVVETVLGRLAVAYRDGRIVYCRAITATDEAVSTADGAWPAFERDVAAALHLRPQLDPAPPAVIARGVRDHLSGRRRLKAVDLSWLTPFQQRVLAKTAEIPRGEVRPYGWIAREIGAPGAVRAVGSALGHNPIPFIIPCHRVVRSDGSLGEYSGGGPEVKRRVLESEGAPIADLVAATARGERLTGSRTTHIVCYPTCHAARRTRPDNIVAFNSLARAEQGGYRPCKLCRPA